MAQHHSAGKDILIAKNKGAKRPHDSAFEACCKVTKRLSALNYLSTGPLLSLPLVVFLFLFVGVILERKGKLNLTTGTLAVILFFLTALCFSRNVGRIHAAVGRRFEQLLGMIQFGKELDLPANTDETMEWREDFGLTKLVPRLYEPRSSSNGSKSSVRTVTMKEVQSHSTVQDLWVVIDGRAYDLTKLQHHHPGGRLPLLNMAGKDCSEAFTEYHPNYVHEKLLAHYCIGPVSDHVVSEMAKDHRLIRQELLRRGLFETDPRYYHMKGFCLLSLILPSVLGVALSDKVWVHMLCAVGLAIFWQQLAFVGHDIGHNSVTHNRESDALYGSMFGVPFLGIGLAWWKRSHNVHHIVCNSIHCDPNIQHQPLMAISNTMFGKVWSTYHERYFITNWIARGLISYQHYFFYPLMAVARVNLCIQGVVTLTKTNEKIKNRWIEVAGMGFFLSWQIALYCCLGSNYERIAFFFLSHAVSGILHVQICLSHFAAEVYKAHPYELDDWFTVQLRTTMNVDCPRYLDWFHGGLQFQIEHHMFPRLPRHNLRKARTLVKEMCTRHKLHYKEITFWQANVAMVKRLRSVAMDARKLRAGDGGFFESALWEGMNAAG